MSDTEREEQGKEWPGGIDGLSSRQLGDFNREARAGRLGTAGRDAGATSGLKTDD